MKKRGILFDPHGSGCVASHPMKTLQRFLAHPPQIPLATVWLLNDLAEYRGKQELFTKQSPQKLARLCESAIIESAVASNRIEGVEIDRKRVGTVVFGKGALSDRNEQEVRGYQAALAWIHRDAETLPLTVPTILRLHALSHPDGYDSGRFKEHDGEIMEKHPDGRVTVRFKPLSAAETPAAMEEACPRKRVRCATGTTPHWRTTGRSRRPSTMVDTLQADATGCLHGVSAYGVGIGIPGDPGDPEPPWWDNETTSTRSGCVIDQSTFVIRHDVTGGLQFAR